MMGVLGLGVSPTPKGRTSAWYIIAKQNVVLENWLERDVEGWNHTPFQNLETLYM